MTATKAFLTIAPPVVVPTQPPLGALIFSAGLCSHGLHSVLFDASLDYFQFVLHRHLSENQTAENLASLQRRAVQAIHYFQVQRKYTPVLHRTHINNLHHFLSAWSCRFAGWQLGITDVTFNKILPHEPEKFLAHLEAGAETPFTEYIQTALLPAIQSIRIPNIGISLTYISQIYFALELGLALRKAGVQAVIGGALLKILDSRTQTEFDFYKLFQRRHPLVPDEMLNPCAVVAPKQWPVLVKKLDEYFTPVPVIPFLLSKGCYWNKCLFCPDHQMKYQAVPVDSLTHFLKEAYSQTKKAEIIFNIADSAIPIARLNQMLPFFKSVQCQFYGFFRFEKPLMQSGYLEEIYHANGRLLQFGLESGSPRLLALYQKGIDLKAAEMILNLARKTGLRNYVYLLFGLPTETENDRELTMQFVRENSAAIDFLNLALFNLPVDCDLLARAAELDLVLTEDLRYQKPLQFYVPFTTSHGPVRDQARRFLQQKFKRDLLIRPLVLNTPDRIRIDHAVFFE